MVTSKILVTGIGGIGGVNFVNALQIFKDEFFIVGTDFNKFYLQFADVDVRVNSPRHSDPTFLKLISELIERYKIEFLHPQPSSEALIVSRQRQTIGSRILLPNPQVMSMDKLETQRMLENKVPVARTSTISNEDDIYKAFDTLAKAGPLWVRAKQGAGGNLSLLCKDPTEAKHWINLWVLQKRASYDDFIIQEYLPGKNMAWDSFWFDGKFVASFTRERLEYPFKHISPSGITGTPTVSRITKDDKINEICRKAITSADSKPHGNYAVDLKEGEDGTYRVTEIDSGKFHTTTPLWGFISTRHFKQDPHYNLPYLYTKLGLEKISNPDLLGEDIYPDNVYLIRHIDCGTWIYRNNGSKEKVL